MAQRIVAVNVSASQFSQPDSVPKVTALLVLLALLARTGAPPSRLKLELTESILLEDIDEVSQKMHTLQDFGITFSLDDFGTGYSSLSYLKKLPLSQLKNRPLLRPARAAQPQRRGDRPDHYRPGAQPLAGSGR